MRTSTRAVGIAALVTVVAGAIGITRVLQVGRQPDRNEFQLAAARSPRRTFEGRLVGFDYAPSPNVSRGKTLPNVHLKAAAARIIASTPTGLDAAIAHAFSGDLDAASHLIRQSLEEDPADTAAWTTLATVRLEVGTRRSQPRELLAAVAAADRALQLKPNMAEAAFNRAVALESLSLHTMAVSAYEKYLLLDGSSEWSSEVRSRLKNIRAKRHDDWNVAREILEKAVSDGNEAVIASIVRRHPLSARTWGETIYLGRWGKAVVSNDRQEAQRALAIAAAIGAELARWTSETLLGDVVARLREADDSTLSEAATAHSTYMDGRRAYSEGRLEAGRYLLNEAASGFERTRSPMAHLARHFSANASFDRTDNARCLQVQNDIVQAARPGHRALVGQALWQRSTVYGHDGRYYEALADASRALQVFEELHEDDNAAQMSAHIAILLARLGDPARAWEAWGAIFQRVDGDRNPKLLAGSLNAAARFELREQQWDIAETLFGLQLNLKQDPRARFDALLWSSYARSRTGRSAADLLGELDRTAAAIPDAVVRETALRDAQFARAALMPLAQASAALALMTDVIGADTRTGSISRLPQAHRERARLYRLLHEDEAALKDLQKAAALISKAGDAVQDDDLRDRFFGASHDVFAELADLLAARREPDGALRALSRGQAAQVLSALPAATLIVHHVVFDDHVLLVFGDSRGSGAVSVDISRARFERLIENLRTAIAGGDTPAIRAASQELHRVLIAPLPRFDHLIVIPDLATSSIPFAALRSKDRGAWLIEEARISIAPAWNVYGEPAIAHPSNKVLVVGDPQFDPALFPDLLRLRAAATEATSVARLHGSNATLLTAREATTERFAAEARRAGIVHIGAHALVDPADARDSAILLCTPLYLRDIRNLDLENNPVIVIAGCQTGQTGGGRGTVRTIASAFLAAGSRAVIGTLWDVGDEEAAALAVPLHRELAAGVPPKEALRNTQLRLLKHGAPTRSWSGFQVYEAAATAARERGR